MLVRDTTFVVTDTETTGGFPKRDRVIEIGAVKIRNGEITDRFSQLINPHRSVPWRITQLTGISTAMVFDQPSAAQVLPAYMDFLGDGVLVAHNLNFDERFLNAEMRRLGESIIPNSSLCTLRLARRILRGLRSKGLSSLSDFYGIKIANRHRALDDAEATGIILMKFLEAVSFEHKIEDLPALISFQATSYRSKYGDSRHVERIRTEVLGALPPKAGVYFMHDRNGRIIYVGKAKNLRARVRTYFTALEAHPPRTRKLVREVRDVSWKETGSELAALLEESRLIKTHQPKHNRALRRFARKPFIKLDTSKKFPTVSFTHYIVDDGAEYFGPLAGGKFAAFVVDIIDHLFQLRQCTDHTLRLGKSCMYGEIGQCLMPCENKSGAERYEEELNRVRKFLRGEDTSVVAQLESQMREAAEKLDFEEARRCRDWLHELERAFSRQRVVAESVLKHNAVIVLPSTDEDKVQLFFVRFGRYVYNVCVPSKPRAADRRRLLAEVTTFFDPDQLRPARYKREEVDEIRVLLNWLHANRNSTSKVSWDRNTAPVEFVEQILSTITKSDDAEQDSELSVEVSTEVQQMEQKKPSRPIVRSPGTIRMPAPRFE